MPSVDASSVAAARNRSSSERPGSLPIDRVASPGLRDPVDAWPVRPRASASLTERLASARARPSGTTSGTPLRASQFAGRTTRLRVAPVAGVSFRPRHRSRRLVRPRADGSALVPEPENEHDPNAIGIWNEQRTLAGRLRPRDVAAGARRATSRPISLWRVEGGLRVLIVAGGTPGSGRPARRFSFRGRTSSSSRISAKA
jgi:hypothetical protein